MLVEEIGMFGSTRTNLYGSVLVADRCLWIGEFQPWWIGAWIVACDREWRERVSDGEWRERVSNHELVCKMIIQIIIKKVRKMII